MSWFDMGYVKVTAKNKLNAHLLRNRQRVHASLSHIVRNQCSQVGQVVMNHQNLAFISGLRRKKGAYALLCRGGDAPPFHRSPKRRVDSQHRNIL